jgi:hypothetical protein
MGITLGRSAKTNIIKIIATSKQVIFKNSFPFSNIALQKYNIEASEKEIDR